jgi:hypothetical protein
MTTERNLERLLRETVGELAGEGRPVDLSAPALRAARQVRVRQAVAAAAGVLIVVVGIAFAVTRSGYDRSVPPADPSVSASADATPTRAPSPTDTGSTDPGTAPVLLPGGWLIRAAPSGDHDLVLYDEQMSRYRVVVNRGPTVPSPNGRYLATVAQNTLSVTTYPEGREVYRQNQVSDGVRPVWSLDSSRVAFVIYNNDGTRVRTGRVADGIETTSGVVQCSNGCVLRWLEDGQRIRAYAGSNYRVDVSLKDGSVGQPSTPDDPCGRQALAYRIDTASWLCVTATGFVVTTNAGAAGQRVPFPTQLDGVAVAAGDATGWALFRPK